jgi:hypothetical protein
MEGTERIIKDAPFSSSDWLWLHDICRHERNRKVYNLKVASLKWAMKTAISPADLVRIAESSKTYREKAFNELLKFEFALEKEGVIQLLLRSSWKQLHSIGLYLDGKRKLALTRK